MKTSPLIPAGLAITLLLPACSWNTAPAYQAAGYSPRDAYHRGQVDGSGDRYHGLAYDPHVNEDRSLPRAYRQDYLWGYVDGYRGRSTGGGK